MAFCVFLMFLYVFAFPIAKIPYLDSSIVAFVVLFILALKEKRVRKELKCVLSKRGVRNIALLWSAVFIYSFLMPIVHSTGDFSLIKTLVHQALSLVIGVFFIAFLNAKGVKVMDVIIWAFVVQSCIQIVSLLCPPIKESLNIFRNQATIDIQKRYAGIRGLAVSGYAVFGLAVAYGLMFIVWAIEWDKTLVRVPVFAKMCMVVLLVFGTMSAGRTGLVGFALAVCIRVFLIFEKRVVSVRSAIVVICFLGFACCSLFVMSRMELSQTIDDLFSYVNEFFNNLLSGNGFTSSSTDKLWDMYFRIDPDYWLFGCGRYTNADGTYFMNTDAGYMRNILYFGVFGLLLLFAYQCAFFEFKGRKNKLKSAIYIVFLLVMHIKGEVIGFLIISQSILFLIRFEKQKEVVYESENIMSDVKLQHKCRLFTTSD